jgi:hypothetical protein
MPKPKVFLSHSSADQRALLTLRDLLERKTAAAIDFFLSSDGQSIPLGRNWVHRIQQALDEAQLLLVFLTPNSVKSQWVFFESGYVYAKSIKVIPVGVLGFDLGSLRPPLSLLQGFNIAGADGLNNIIALLNREFGFTFEEAITDAEYGSIFGMEIGGSSAEKHILSHVDKIELRIAGKVEEIFGAARTTFRELEIETRDAGYLLEIPGATFSIQRYPKDSEKGSVYAEMDAALLPVVQPVLDAMLKDREADAPASFTLTFQDHVVMATERHKLRLPFSAKVRESLMTISLQWAIRNSGLVTTGRVISLAIPRTARFGSRFA